MPTEISKTVLEKIIKGEVKNEYKFFAFKILLTRLQNTFKQEPEKLDECVSELEKFCEQHEDNPQFKSDIEKFK